MSTPPPNPRNQGDAESLPHAGAPASANEQSPAGPTGILVIDKPLGLTSASVCNVVKARLRRGGAPKRVKVGHAGTLDPMATGVLIVLVGRSATRLAETLMAGQKRYLADIDLAHTSESDDTERELTPVPVDRVPTFEEVARAVGGHVGTIMQRPPDHSAIRVDGRRAYKIARKGRDPELAPRPVLVHAIEIVSYAWPRLMLDISCGKGVYVRSLARDLGTVLATGGMLAGLRRTRVGPFTIEQSVDLHDLPDPLAEENLIPVPGNGSHGVHEHRAPFAPPPPAGEVSDEAPRV